MDTFTALGVAVAIVQFVDFSVQLIKDGYRISCSSAGELVKEKQRRSAVKTLQRLNARIQETSRAYSLASADTETEENLKSLCNGCNETARELLDVLDKLRPSSPRKSGRKGENKEKDELESFEHAALNKWNKDKFEQLERRLEEYRRQTTVSVIVVMREQYANIDGNVLKMTKESRYLRDEIVRHVKQSQKWQETVIEEITKDPKPYPSPLGLLTVEGFVPKVLSFLDFEVMQNQEERIPAAHSRTFQWVFKHPKRRQKSWSDFSAWLSSDSSIYWITGKAGAGKSTLMKFINASTRTQSLVERGLQERFSHFIFANHYFCNSGAELQMSQQGLLRTLIYQIIQQKPSLARTGFPEESELHQLFSLWTSKSITLAKLQRALDLMVKSTPEVCFVLFIDGLDEFTGDHSTLIEFVKRLSNNPNVKICVASRPWPVFEDAFQTGPNLRIEDLTYRDIVAFVESKFKESKGHAEMQVESPERAQELMRDIAVKASGVFLWVSLVVDCLIQGLADGEKVSVLYRRLNGMPRDLEGLFQKMINSINPERLEHASQIFKIVIAARQPITLFCMSFVDEDDPDLPFRYPIEPMPDQERVARSQRMRGKLNSHCKGLLEATWESETDAIVTYLHRTVRDYLHRKSVWPTLILKTRPDFDPSSALCKAFLLQLKCMRPVASNMGHDFDSTEPRRGTLSEMVPWFVQYASDTHDHTGRPPLELYDEFARTLETLLGTTPRCVPCCWCNGPADHSDGPFLSLAIKLQMTAYVDARLTCHQPSHQKKVSAGLTLLQTAMNDCCAFKSVPEALLPAARHEEPSIDMVKLLLKRGANPSTSFVNSMEQPWQSVLAKPKLWKPEVLQLCLERGADPNVPTMGGGPSPWMRVLQDPSMKSPELYLSFLEHGADPTVDLGSKKSWLP
ncbi:P-loop containing nucleoside triphosphate hydrolase [Neofusicoccum parvum]|nr:P-loop containing nucleoside triphosphate hydrolase [Neofusicoccum parvum]